MKRVVVGIGIALLLGNATSGFAQNTSPYSFEVRVGPSWGSSDNDRGYCGSQDGILADLLVARRLHHPDRNGATIAVNFAVHAYNIEQSECGFDPITREYIPYFPGHGGIFLLGGWESRNTSFRISAGPGIANPEYERVAGFVARLDAAAAPVFHMSFAGTISGLYVPSWKGDSFAYLALGIGLRMR